MDRLFLYNQNKSTTMPAAIQKTDNTFYWSTDVLVVWLVMPMLDNNKKGNDKCEWFFFFFEKQTHFERGN